MYRETRVVKLRRSGVKASIAVMAKDDAALVAGYSGPASSKYSYQVRVMLSFCENYLTTIIPTAVGMDKIQRRTMFEELYQAIVEHNPTVDRTKSGLSIDVVALTGAAVPEKKTQKSKLEPVTARKASTIVDALAKSIFGQDKALQRVQELFECAVTGLGDPNKPRGAFVFVGNSGTGKTQAVFELARHFWGGDFKAGVYKINGSEFMAEHEMSKLAGAPASYVGYEDGSPFLRHVQANPETIILVDEFEKAHPKLQDLFLQILDTGNFTDNKGNVIDFSRTFVVFTSNIGTREVYHRRTFGFVDTGHTEEEVELSVTAALDDFCRVEFLKRLDGVVVFERLGMDTLERIAKKEADILSARLKEKGIRLNCKKAVSAYIVSNADPNDTARDIQRLFRKEVTMPISRLLVQESDYDYISVALSGDELQICGGRNGEEAEDA